MTEYTGSAMAACWNGISIPGLRRVNLDASADLQKLDVTHAGDTSQKMVDGLPNACTYTVTISGVMQAGSQNNLPGGSAFAVRTSGSLIFYPEGPAAGKPKRTLKPAFISKISNGPSYNEVATYEMTITNRASGSLIYGVAP